MRFVPFFVLILLVRLAPAQSFLWTESPDGIGNDVGNSVDADAAGNVFLTGHFSGQAQFQDTFFFSNDGFQFFIAKYDANGNELWVKNGGGALSDEGASLKTTSNGGVVVTGTFEGSAQFSGSTIHSQGGKDVFLAQYDSGGNLLWIRSWGGPGDEKAGALDADANGNIVVCNMFESGLSLNGNAFTSLGYGDILVSTWDPSGGLMHAKRYGDLNDDFATGIFWEDDGSIRLGGYYYYQTRFDTSVLNAAGSSDVFLVKLRNDLSVQQTMSAGGPLSEACFAIAPGASGQTWMGGYFMGSAQFGNFTLQDTGYNDIFLALFDSSAACRKALRLGGPGLDVCNGLASADSGGVYVTGSFENGARMGSFSLNAQGKDIFIASVSADARVELVQRAGGSQEDLGLSLCRSGGQDLYVTGYFHGFSFFGGQQLGVQGSGIFLSRVSMAPLAREISGPIRFSLYPNPSPGWLRIRSEAIISSWKLLDINGKETANGNWEGNSTERELQLEASLPGMYLLELETREGLRALQRLIIQK